VTRVEIRQATPADSAAISRMLQALTAADRRTRPSDVDFVRDNYVFARNGVSCFLAMAADGTVLGLQSLKVAEPGNEWNVEPGWGIIGTHVSPAAPRRGIGRALFAETRKAALAAGLTRIDASIGANNAEGRAYCEAMGFRTYRTPAGYDCKCWRAEGG
jgi:L-amino acid N-acyltransferase YncA